MSGEGPSTGEDSGIYWCDEDLPGKHTATGAFKVWNGSYDEVATQDVTLDFTVRKMTIRASLRATKKSVKVKQVFSLKGCVTAHGKRQEYRDIVWEQKWPGKPWKRLGRGTTDTVGCYSQAVYMGRAGTASLRTRVPGDSISKTGYSKVIKVKTRK
jgi:hypothetical protein